MKKNYASLLNQITELYIEALSQMYFWDHKCDVEKNMDLLKMYCDIRNKYAQEASAYFKILDNEVSEEDIVDMHRTAREQAEVK